MSTAIVDLGENIWHCRRMSMTPEQCRAARAWLGLKQDELATAAGVGLSTLKDFEAGKRTPIANNLAAIEAALEAQGMGFVSATDDNGKTWACGITFAPPEKGTAH